MKYMNGNALLAITRSGDALVDFYMFDEPQPFLASAGETNIGNGLSGDRDGYVYNSSTEVAGFDSDGGALIYQAGLSLGSLDFGIIGLYR